MRLFFVFAFALVAALLVGTREPRDRSGLHLRSLFSSVRAPSRAFFGRRGMLHRTCSSVLHVGTREPRDRSGQLLFVFVFGRATSQESMRDRSGRHSKLPDVSHCTGHTSRGWRHLLKDPGVLLKDPGVLLKDPGVL